jgi:pimeloyl-ACP methyl ester carboxylesterase
MIRILSRVAALLLLGSICPQLRATGIASGQLLSLEEAQRVPVAEGFATTPDGVRLYYRIAGTGEQVAMAPFALYHGTALDRLARDRRIVTYDPRGRGKSQAVAPDKVSLDLLLIDLETVRAAVGARKIALIGWSGAGMETFVYTLRNPGRVSRLVQLAPVGPRLAPYGEQMLADRQKRTDVTAQAALREQRKTGDFKNDPASECRADAAVTLPPLFFDRSKVRLIPDVCVYPNEYPDALGFYSAACSNPSTVTTGEARSRV